MTPVSEAVERVGRWANYPHTTNDQVAVSSPLVTFTAGDLRAILAALDDRDAQIARLTEQVRVAREAMPDLTHVINWLDQGCNSEHAATELRIHQARITAALTRMEKNDEPS